MRPGDRGSLDTRTTPEGVVQGYFIPKESPRAGTEAARRLAAGVKLVEADPATSELVIYPTDTRSWDRNFLGPKYEQVTKIVLPCEVDEYFDLTDTLEALPSGLTKDYEYGLGLAQECDPIVDLIEKSTRCTTIELVGSGEPSVAGPVFRLSYNRLAALRAELARIKARGNNGIRRVKEAFVHNDLAPALGLDPKAYSLGRHPTSQWITRVAGGEEPLNDEEQDALLAATTASAAQIAARKPARMSRLQRDIEVVNLDQLITSYEKALDAEHNEHWWQSFFEENIFALQLLFGGPTVFIDSQVPIGEGDNSPKGKKIADYLLMNAMTSNASLVEIKTPSTQLLKRNPYRAGVYGVHSEISQAVTQVLDQALQLTRHEVYTKPRTNNWSWVSNAPRSFVVAGRACELDSPDKRKSFDLYREHLSGVRVVAYDEILEQLKTLRDFLASEVADAMDANAAGGVLSPSSTGRLLMRG
jgi:hypothetical protein